MARNSVVKRYACTVCDGKTSRNGKACTACGKKLPPTPKMPGRNLPKGQHKAKKKVAAKSNPADFRRAH